MILLGRPVISAERRALLLSAYMATTDTDKVRMIFCSAQEKADLIVLDYMDEQGQHYAMGRVRLHVDDKVRDSADPKFPFEIVASPQVPVALWDEKVVKAVILFSTLYGLEGPIALDLRANPLSGEAFHKVFEEFLTEAGFNLSILDQRPNDVQTPR